MPEPGPETTVVVDLLVRDALLVATCDADQRELAGGWIAMADGAIVGVGIAGDEPTATTTIDASGCLVTPGLINTHHHLYQNLTRALRGATDKTRATDKTLFPWLQTLYP